MKIIKLTLLIITAGIIYFACYFSQPDRTWLSEHSEISSNEIRSEMMIEQSINRQNRLR